MLVVGLKRIVLLFLNYCNESVYNAYLWSISLCLVVVIMHICGQLIVWLSILPDVCLNFSKRMFFSDS